MKELSQYKIYHCNKYSETEFTTIEASSFLDAVRKYSDNLTKTSDMFIKYKGNWKSIGSKVGKPLNTRYYKNSNGKKLLVILDKGKIK